MTAEDVASRMQVDAKGAIIDVMKALQGLDADKQATTLSDLFGKESIGAIAPLLSNLENLQENFDKVADASQYAGSMQKEYEERSKTTECQLKKAEGGTERACNQCRKCVVACHRESYGESRSSIERVCRMGGGK